MKMSKRLKKMLENAPKREGLDVKEAIRLCKSNATAKFDESIEISVNLGVDPKYADQIVRGVVSLPNGTGKTVRVLVLAREEKAKLALAAGADYAGLEEYADKIKNGWLDFDVVIATPDLMGEVGKLAKILGPRGLMPNPKSGTVSMDVEKAVKEVKAGKIDFRTDKKGIIHAAVGKASFGEEQLFENIMELVKRIIALKPATAKGVYLKKLTLTSTMGLGYDVEKTSVTSLINS